MGCADSKPLGLAAGSSSNMSDPPFLSQEQFAQLALEIVTNSYGDKFTFELDKDNFCILFRNKENTDNVGKMYLQNRFQCMQTYGQDITMDKVREIINDSTDGLTFYSQPAMTVGEKDLAQLFPMVKTPQWFSSYQETMTSHGCRETIFQLPVDDSKVISMTLALNYGKFRRYVTQEEVAEWRAAFDIDPVKEAKKNLKSRFSADGAVKKEWENPAASGVVWRAQLPDELSASLIVLPENINKFKVKGDPVAIFPVASVLYVTGSKDEEGLRVMVDLALEYLNYPHFLTLQPLKLTPKIELSGKSWLWSSFESPIIMDKLRTRNYEANLASEKAASSQRRPLSIGSSGGISVGVSVQDLLKEDDNPSKFTLEGQSTSAIQQAEAPEVSEMMHSEMNGHESWMVAEPPETVVEAPLKQKSPPPPPPPEIPPPPLTPPPHHRDNTPKCQDEVVPSPSPLPSRIAPLCDGEVLPKDIEAELVEAAMEEPEASQEVLEEDAIFSDVATQEIDSIAFSVEEQELVNGTVMFAIAEEASTTVDEAAAADNKTEDQIESSADKSVEVRKPEIDEACKVAQASLKVVSDVIVVDADVTAAETDVTVVESKSSKSEHVQERCPEAGVIVADTAATEVKADADVTVLESTSSALLKLEAQSDINVSNNIPHVNLNGGDSKLITEELNQNTEIVEISSNSAVKDETVGELFQKRKEEVKGQRKKSNSKSSETKDHKTNEKAKEGTTEKQLAKIEARGKEKRVRQKSLSDNKKGNEQKKDKKDNKTKTKEVAEDSATLVEDQSTMDLSSDKKDKSQPTNTIELGLSHENIWFDSHKYESAYTESLIHSSEEASSKTTLVLAAQEEVVSEKDIINPFYVKDEQIEANLEKQAQSGNDLKVGLSQENVWLDQLKYDDALVQQQLSLIKVNSIKIDEAVVAADVTEADVNVNVIESSSSSEHAQESVKIDSDVTVEDTDVTVADTEQAHENVKIDSDVIVVNCEVVEADTDVAVVESKPSEHGQESSVPDVNKEKDSQTHLVKEHILNRSLPPPQLLPLTAEEKANIQKHEKLQTCSNISHQLRNEFARATDHAASIKSKIDESNESAENLLAELKTRKAKNVKSPTTAEAPVDVQQEIKSVESPIQEEIGGKSKAPRTKKEREHKKSEKKTSESERVEVDKKQDVAPLDVQPEVTPLESPILEEIGGKSKAPRTKKGRERKKSEKKTSENERVEVDDKQDAAPVDVQPEVMPVEIPIQEVTGGKSKAPKVKKERERKKSEKKISESERGEGDEGEKSKRKKKGSKTEQEGDICSKDMVQDAQNAKVETNTTEVGGELNEVDAFDFFSAVPLGSAAVEAEKNALMENVVFKQDPVSMDLPSNISTEKTEVGVEDNEVDAFDFFSAVPLGSAAVEAEKNALMEANIWGQGSISIELPSDDSTAVTMIDDATLDSSHETVKENVIAEEENVDAFDFFSPVPIGSAAVEAEKKVPKGDKSSCEVNEIVTASNKNVTSTDSADSQFELYNDVPEASSIPAIIEPQTVLQRMTEDELLLCEELVLQPLSKDFKRKSFAKSEGGLLDDFQGVSRPPSLLEFEENVKCTAMTKKVSMMKSSGNILESFHEAEEPTLNEEKEKSSISKKKQYKGARRHTGELNMVRNKLTMIDMEETYDGHDDEDEEDDGTVGEDHLVEADEKERAVEDVVKIESGMKEVFLTAEYLPPVPDEEKDTFSFAQIAKGSRLRKRSESLCSIDADVTSSMQTSIVSLQEYETQCEGDLISELTESPSLEGSTADSQGLIADEFKSLAPEQTVLPAEQTVAPVPEQTEVPASEEKLVPAPEETVVSAPEETVVLASEESLMKAPEETVEPAPEQTAVPAPEDTEVPASEETIVPAPEETVVTAPEQIVASVPEETVVPAQEQMVVPVPDQTEVAALEETEVSAPEVTEVSAPEEAVVPAAVVNEIGELHQTSSDVADGHILSRPLPTPIQLKLTPEEVSNVKKHKKVNAVKNVNQQLQNEFVRASENAQSIKSQVEESNASAESLLSQVKSRNQEPEVIGSTNQADNKKRRKKKPVDVVPKDQKSPTPKLAPIENVDPWGESSILLDKKHLQLMGLSGSAWNAMQNSQAENSEGSAFLHLDTTFICFSCGMDAVAMKEKLMKCKRCMIASYCGKECQKSNWLKHKKICKCVGSRRQKGETEPLKIFL